MKNVYRKIKEIRELKGYKQDDLANHLGLVRSSYNKIENAKTALTIENLQKIADFLGVSVEEILFDKQSSQDTTEKDRRIRELEQEKRLLEWELGLREKEYKTTMYWIERLNELRESILPKLEQRESFVINSLLEYVKAVKENTNFTDNNA
jgi:transcriptional regulator with XRE-family HTH domain